MRIALAGVGRMGTVVAGRLRSAGHELALYDPALPGSLPSLADAARGGEIALLFLPDADAVEASVPALARAAPPVVVDLTSSLPATTRRVGAALAARGVRYLDCALSGGVAGAAAGTLTAIAGGDRELLAGVRPVLAAFASTVRWAGPLGAGHATKALNNTLSAASLLGTAEMLVTAVAFAADEAAALSAVNAGPARSQNSEVKFPRDVLPRTYAAGFTAGLMAKDLGNALAIAADRSTAAPLLAGALAAWRDATRAMGPGGDFTRIHEVVASRTGGGRPASRDGYSLEVLTRALASLHVVAVAEVLRVAAAEGLDEARLLDIVNVSTGRTGATRSWPAAEVDRGALAAAADLARRAGAWAPLTTLAAALAGGAAV